MHFYAFQGILRFALMCISSALMRIRAAKVTFAPPFFAFFGHSPRILPTTMEPVGGGSKRFYSEATSELHLRRFAHLLRIFTHSCASGVHTSLSCTVASCV